MTDQVDAEAIAAKLTRGGREFIVSQLWEDSPKGIPALACDTRFHSAKQLEHLRLALRLPDGAGTAWYYLTDLGASVRDVLMKEKG